MSAWGKSLAWSGERHQTSTPSASVPDSVGSRQSEMSRGFSGALGEPGVAGTDNTGLAVSH